MLPLAPTDERPGSEGKIRVLEQRAGDGFQLFHPLDLAGFAVWVQRQLSRGHLFEDFAERDLTYATETVRQPKRPRPAR
jgi:hypothetical protein